MNIAVIVICCMVIAFFCGFLAREALDFGKMLIKNLQRIRLEIDIGNSGSTTPDWKIPPNPSDERLRIQSKVVETSSNSEQPR